MTATELFQAGKLADAIAAQTADVKAKPADHGKRMFLFELLMFAGDIDRATKHLDAVRSDTPELVVAAQQYKQAIEAEEKRRKCLAGQAIPTFFGDPPDHLTVRAGALTALASGDTATAVDLLNKALAAAPDVSGSLNGKPFAGLRDADDLFAGTIELFAQGNYFWVPVEQILALAANPPKFPRDLLLLPAKITLVDGSTGDVFLPALYPNSHLADDEAIKLGRATNWDGPDGATRGIGHRVLLAGDDDVGILDLRELTLGDATE